MKKTTLLVLTITVLAGLLRMVKLSEIPPGLYWDEASIGYNAYSILKTGKDEHGRAYPLLFAAFGEQKLPVYIYATALSIRLFGRNDLAVRFPSALAGTLTVLLTYFLVKELFRKAPGTRHQAPGTLAAVAALLLAISPWHIHFSRGGFEANLALFFLVAAVLTFFLAIRGRRNALVVSVILFILASATYNSDRLFAPLLLLTLVLIYRKELARSKAALRIAIIVGVVLSLPFLPQIISGQALLRAKSEGILGEPQPVTRFLSNYMSNFDPTYLFFKGDQVGRHSVRKLGMLYVFELPLILLGMRKLLGRPSKASRTILCWLLLAPIPAALTKLNPHALRGLNILPSWQVIAGAGLMTIVEWARSKPRVVKIMSITGVSMIILYNVVLHQHQYYVHYYRETALDWQDGLKKAAEVISERYDNYEEIFVSQDLPPVYLGFYLPIEPAEYQRVNPYEKIGKMTYFSLASEARKSSENKALFIAPFWQTPPDRIPYEQIKMVNGDTVFNIWED